MKSILVTGGCGYIGSHTCLLLLELGYQVYIIDSNINSKSKVIERILKLAGLSNELANNNLHFEKGDLNDYIFLEKFFSKLKIQNIKLDAVIHFAGLKAIKESKQDPLKYWKNNVSATLNLLLLMDKNNCKNIVFSSSATIYGNNNSNLISEEEPIQPINPYGRTKVAIEEILNDIYISSPNDWRIASLRYFNPVGAHPSGIIGEDQIGIPTNIFPLINKVASRHLDELVIFGNNWNTYDGTGERDYIHVMDLAEGHIETLKYLFDNKAQKLNLNLGTGKGTSVLKIIETYEKINKVKIPFKFGKRRSGDVGRSVADITKAKTILNWEAKRSLEEMCLNGWNWQKMNPNGY